MRGVGQKPPNRRVLNTGGHPLAVLIMPLLGTPPPSFASRYTYCMSRRNFFGGKQLRVYEGRNRATRCAVIRGARGDPERARETYTTPPSAARSARCAHAGASLQTSTVAPEAWHRSGPPPRAGTPGDGATTQSLQIPCDALPARLSYFRLLEMASSYSMLVGSY